MKCSVKKEANEVDTEKKFGAVGVQGALIPKFKCPLFRIKDC